MLCIWVFYLIVFCAPHIFLVPGKGKRVFVFHGIGVSDDHESPCRSWEPNICVLQKIISHHVAAGIQTCIVWKKNSSVLKCWAITTDAKICPLNLCCSIFWTQHVFIHFFQAYQFSYNWQDFNDFEGWIVFHYVLMSPLYLPTFREPWGWFGLGVVLSSG